MFTELERSIVLKAANDIASSRKFYCCYALGHVEYGSWDEHEVRDHLVVEFGLFYKKSIGANWFPIIKKSYNAKFQYLTEARDARVLLLLLFLEANS